MTAPCIEQMNANSTHIPILAGIVSRTNGSVLELGVGHYSTPMLHYLCDNRILMSVETNVKWWKWFRDFYESKNHIFRIYDKKISEINEPFRENWSVAFVDCSPEKDRKNCVIKLRDKAKFIVVHDAEPQASIYQWDGIFETFKYKYYWDRYGNGTVVVSDFEEIPL